MPDLLKLAEDVIIARQNLAAAEAAFRAAEGKVPRATKPGPKGVPSVPISQRVRDLLKDAKKPLTFREVVNLLGGGDIDMAVRSAIKNARAKGDVVFKGGFYSWKEGKAGK